MPRRDVSIFQGLYTASFAVASNVERFPDDVDRDDFLSRLIELTTTSSTRCFAWALYHISFISKALQNQVCALIKPVQRSLEFLARLSRLEQFLPL